MPLKYCVSNRISPVYIAKAQQIRIQERDINEVPSISEKYPDKDLIVEYDGNAPLSKINILKKLPNRVFVETNSLALMTLKELELPRFLATPIRSFADAQAAIDLGASYLNIAPPLFFLVDRAAAMPVPWRINLNNVWYGSIPQEKGYCGLWIRPDDIELYAALPGAVIDLSKYEYSAQEAVFRLYAEGESWSGNLNVLIPELNYEVPNRMLDERITQARLNCGQKCAEGRCVICPTIFNLTKKLTKE